jgi:hypothetical protein
MNSNGAPYAEELRREGIVDRAAPFSVRGTSSTRKDPSIVK